MKSCSASNASRSMREVLRSRRSCRPRRPRAQPLARRLAHNGAVLLEAYRDIVKAINEGRAITPAAEWLVDNYHLVEKQIRELRSDLPPGYYRQLPKLASGPFAGYPRVFGVTWAFVAHTDSRFDSEMLVRYVSGLSGGAAAHHWRTVGGVDHAADRAGRESPTPR